MKQIPLLLKKQIAVCNAEPSYYVAHVHTDHPLFESPIFQAIQGNTYQEFLTQTIHFKNIPKQIGGILERGIGQSGAWTIGDDTLRLTLPDGTRFTLSPSEFDDLHRAVDQLLLQNDFERLFDPLFQSANDIASRIPLDQIPNLQKHFVTHYVTRQGVTQADLEILANLTQLEVRGKMAFTNTDWTAVIARAKEGLDVIIHANFSDFAVAVPESLAGVKEVNLSFAYNIPPEFIPLALADGVESIDLRDCDLTGVTVPESLAGVKGLNLKAARNIPPELISRALADGVESIDLRWCNLIGVTVPESLAGVKALNLSLTENIPIELISRALADGVESMELECDLTGVTVPESLAGVKALNLSLTQNIPPELISRALADGVESIYLMGCDLTGVTVPESLAGVKGLNLKAARNIPPELISRALADGVESIDLSECNLTGVTVPESLAGVKKLNLYSTKNIPLELRSHLRWQMGWN